MVTVLLANKHRLIRQALARILAQEPSIKVLGDANSEDELCQKAVKLKPDIIVMDSFHLDTHQNKDVSLLMSEQDPQVVIWPQNKQQSLKTSEISYDDDIEKLIKVIKKANTVRTQRNLSRYDLLTRREKEILHLVAEGLSNRQISLSLFITERTVKYHIGNILRKLNLSSRLEAALYFHQNKAV